MLGGDCSIALHPRLPPTLPTNSVAPTTTQFISSTLRATSSFTLHTNAITTPPPQSKLQPQPEPRPAPNSAPQNAKTAISRARNRCVSEAHTAALRCF